MNVLFYVMILDIDSYKFNLPSFISWYPSEAKNNIAYNRTLATSTILIRNAYSASYPSFFYTKLDVIVSDITLACNKIVSVHF